MPTAPTANPISYEIYNFILAWILLNNGAGTPAIIAVPVDKPNKVAMAFDTQTIQFEGGGTIDKVFLTNGCDLTFDTDALTMTARSDIFNQALTTTAAGYTNRLYGGTRAENTGVTAGFRGRANAKKRVNGTEVGIVLVDLEIFSGTLTVANGGAGLTTSGKAELQQMKLSANQAALDLLGVALVGVPTGGAFYAISEVTP